MFDMPVKVSSIFGNQNFQIQIRKKKKKRIWKFWCSHQPQHQHLEVAVLGGSAVQGGRLAWGFVCGCPKPLISELRYGIFRACQGMGNGHWGGGCAVSCGRCELALRGRGCFVCLKSHPFGGAALLTGFSPISLETTCLISCGMSQVLLLSFLLWSG